jgi:hypothetical protein
MSYEGSGTTPVVYSDTTQIDSFGRLRTSDSHILLDSQFDFDLQPLLWETSVSGGATVTHDEPDASAIMAVPAAVSEAVRQTRRYWKYRAGQSLRITLTFTLGSATAGIEKEIGFNDAANGIFLKQTTAGVLQLVRRTNVTGSPVDNTVDQASWNQDPLNGSGPSGITLNPALSQIFWIDLQWLGVGRVRAGFNINGVDICVHEFLHANNLSTVYMSTATLPVRYRINNITGANSDSMAQICSSVFWEGGAEGPGYLTSVDMGITPYTATTTLTSILAVRLNSTHIRATLRPLVFEVINQGNNEVRAVLLHFQPGSIPGGLSWGAASGDASEFSTSNVAITEANGYRIQTEYILNSTGKKASVQATAVDSYLQVAADIAGTSEVLVLAVQTQASTSDVLGVISYKELY